MDTNETYPHFGKRPSDEDNGGPRPVVSTATGDQRAAGADDLAMPKFDTSAGAKHSTTSVEQHMYMEWGAPATSSFAPKPPSASPAHSPAPAPTPLQEPPAPAVETAPLPSFAISEAPKKMTLAEVFAAQEQAPPSPAPVHETVATPEAEALPSALATESIHAAEYVPEYTPPAPPPPEEAPTFAPEPSYTAPPAAPEPQRSATITQEMLPDILAAHQQWLATEGRSGKRANFRNAHLAGLSFAGTMLVDASFRGADLSHADFTGANLERADLSEANLTHTNLTQASLRSAVLARADLRQTTTQGAFFEGVNFSNAVMMGADFSQLALTGAVFMETDLSGINLAGADLRHANLRGAILTGANLNQANLCSANCRDADFQQAHIDGALLIDANLKGANFHGASMLDANLGETASEAASEGALLAEKEQLHHERHFIDEQRQQLQQLQHATQEREVALQTERHQFEMQRRDLQAKAANFQQLEHEVAGILRMHQQHDRWFKYLALIWFIFAILIVTGLLLLLGALNISHLKWLELVIVFGGILLITAIFIFTVIRSIKTSANLKRLVDISARLRL